MLISLIHCFGFGQQNSLRGNENILGGINMQVDTSLRAEIRQKINEAQFQFEEDSIINTALLEEVLTAAIQNDFLSETADAYLLLSEMNFAVGQYEFALKNGQRALDLYDELRSTDGYLESTQLLGKSALALRLYEKAEQFYLNALYRWGDLKIQEELDLCYGLAKVYLQSNSTMAKRELIALVESSLAHNLVDYAVAPEMDLGKLEQSTGNFELAKRYFTAASLHAREVGNSQFVYESGLALSEIQKLMNDPDGANQTLTDVSNYMSQNGDTALSIGATVALVGLNMDAGNFGEANSLLNYAWTTGGVTATDLATQLTFAEAAYTVYNVTASGGTLASNAFITFSALKDSVDRINEFKKRVSLKNQKALSSIQEEVDILERQRDLDKQTIELLEREKRVNQSEIQNQRILLYVFGVLLLIGTVLGFYIYRTNKARKRANQLLYLKSMRSQMNPHFIFNSLNSVNAFITRNNEREANKYLSRFAKLMRQILEQSESEFISLTKEIEVLELYVQLEHDRFKEVFDYTFEVDASIELDKYEIPPMLVQPFVENAIWHGLRYKDSGGKLQIQFLNCKDHIEIHVKDNGIGREESKRIKTKNQKEHQSAAMQLVENRVRVIEELFKQKIRFEIKDLVNPSGTEVKIYIYPIAEK